MNKPTDPSNGKNRSTFVLFGGGALAICAGLVGLYTMVAGGESAPTEAVPQSVEVLALTEDLSIGTDGDAIVAEELFQSIEMDIADAPADAVLNTSQLLGRELARPVAAGQTLTAADLISTGSDGSVVVPDGYQAVAVSVAFDPAVAGYVQAGDHVDVYSVLTQGGTVAGTAITNDDGTTVLSDSEIQSAAVQTLLQSVQVLDVSTDLDPNYVSDESAVRLSVGSVTYLLAVTPQDAASLIYVKSNYSIYLALTNDTVSDEPVRVDEADVRAESASADDRP